MRDSGSGDPDRALLDNRATLHSTLGSLWPVPQCYLIQQFYQSSGSYNSQTDRSRQDRKCRENISKYFIAQLSANLALDSYR